jgi:hypothetical protein
LVTASHLAIVERGATGIGRMHAAAGNDRWADAGGSVLVTQCWWQSDGGRVLVAHLA